MFSLETPQRKWASSRLEGRTSWIFSICCRCSRLTMGTSGTRSGGLRKDQSPCKLLGGLSGFLSRQCRALGPCVESVSKPEKPQVSPSPAGLGGLGVPPCDQCWDSARAQWGEWVKRPATPCPQGVPVVMVMVAGPYLSQFPLCTVVMRVLDTQTPLTSPFQVLTGGLTEPMSVK